MINSCYICGFWDSDFGCCTCPSYDMWYACPLEPEPMEEDFQKHGLSIDTEFEEN